MLKFARFVILLCLILCGSDSFDLPKVEVVHGFEVVNLTGIVFFQSSIDIHFTIDLPDPVPNLIQYNCTKSGYLCDLVDNTFALGTLFQDRWINNPYLKKIEGTHPDYHTRVGRHRRGAWHWLGVATTQDAHHLHAEVVKVEKQIKEEVETMKHLYGDGLALKANLSSFSKDMLHFLHGSITSLEEGVNKEQEEEKNDVEALSVCVQNLQIIMLHIESVQAVNDAVLECHSHVIPRSVLPDAEFFKKIDELSPILAGHGWEVAGTRNTLLGLPLSNCRWTEKSIVVSSTIPLQRNGTEIYGQRIVKVPFAFEGSTCILHFDSDILVRNGRKVTTISTYKTPECNIMLGFCKVKENGYDYMGFSTCANAVLQNKTWNEIAKKCVFQCRQVTDVVVTEIDDETFAIAYASSIESKCGNNDTRSIYKAGQMQGGVKIRLSCSCALIVNGKTIVERAYPCKSDPELVDVEATVVIPSQWTKQKMKVAANWTYSHSAFKKMIQFDWGSRVPSLNVSGRTSEIDQFFLGSRLSYSEEKSNYLVVWMSIVSVLVFLLTFQVFLNNGIRGTAQSPNPILTFATALPLARSADAINVTALGKFVKSRIQEMEVGIMVGLLLSFISVILTLMILSRILKAVYDIKEMIAKIMNDRRARDADVPERW